MEIKDSRYIFLIVAFVILYPFGIACCQDTGTKSNKAGIKVKTAGFNKVRIETSNDSGLKLLRLPVSGIRSEHGFLSVNNGKWIDRPQHNTSSLLDTVPTGLDEVSYKYVLINTTGDTVATAETNRNEWPSDLLPELILPHRSDWVKLYNKAWELNWHQVASSVALPARFSHNVTPDNGRSYLWDASFSILFQRYAALSGSDPGTATIDNFYAQQQSDGYILRYFTVKDYAAGHNTSKQTPSIEAVNPPLLAWAEWNYFLSSGDLNRLKVVLPKLEKQYRFIDSFLQDTPGKYIWDGNPSGWDNILSKAHHKFWVELPAMQALSAKCMREMAVVLNQPEAAKRYGAEYSRKQDQMEMYWNEKKGWYCSLDSTLNFTQKTLSGMWPVLAGIVPADRMPKIVANLMSKEIFNTGAMPLPSLAKDEPGYNPSGEYWLGSVWINMSLLTIRSLKEHGYEKEAFDLAVHTLNGISDVYEKWKPKPFTLWECYSPEYAAPASHKIKPGLGSVRSDFAGWTACLINLLIENILGIEVNAPDNTIIWNCRLSEDQGIQRLRFGHIITDLLKKGNTITAKSNLPFTLRLIVSGKVTILNVQSGINQFHI